VKTKILIIIVFLWQL